MGAQPRDIIVMVLRQGLLLASIGVVVGIAGALVLTRVMSSMIHGVGRADPITFVSVTIVFVLTTVLACLLPALKAAWVEPMEALRYE
jgi:putative ABC transport system permease protein